MVRFTNIIIGYMIIGAVLWGGGAIAYDNSGIATLFVKDPQTGEINNETASDLRQSGGPIQQASQSVAGGLIAVWNILIKVIGFLFWPVTTLDAANAPPKVMVLLGGPPTTAFFGAVLQVIRGST